MANKTATVSGTVKRFHSDRYHMNSRYVRFTLEGDTTVYRYQVYVELEEQLDLTNPGDSISFEHRESFLSGPELVGFTNHTLNAELKKTL